MTTPTAPLTLRSYLAGEWRAGTGRPAQLLNPATEAVLAETSTEGLDFAAALAWGRATGGPQLRALTFAQRAEALRGVARLLHAKRDELIPLAIANGGNTRGDAKFDIDGASATFAAYADWGEQLGPHTLLLDGESAPIGRSARYVGQHVLTPRHGVALHINAFNFPAWGLAEKAACAWLAGVPIVTKPATATALVAHRIVELILEANLLPEGALQLVCGAPGSLLDHLRPEDVVGFTGSADTGAKLRALDVVVKRSLRLNVEADSLNSATLGPDVEPGTPTWDLFFADVLREITQKTGQKCTAIRRVFVPAARADEVTEELAARLAAIRVGDPALEEVRMGPLATRAQLDEVRRGVALLTAEAKLVLGAAVAPIGVDPGRGFFHAPTLLRTDHPEDARAIHDHEVFGPLATVCVYSGDAAVASELVRRGGGSLVASVYSDDRAFIAGVALGVAPWSGRVFIGSAKIAGQATPPGMAMPQLLHGGPGRAGGGEELGGLRGLGLYLQRTALHGDKPLLESLGGVAMPR